MLKTGAIPNIDNESLLDNADIFSGLSQLVKIIQKITPNVTIEEAYLNHWDELIKNWAMDESLPLYIRKAGDNYPRGKIVVHKTGRRIIPCDNGPAHWAFSMCYNGNLTNFSEISSIINSDQIPIAMILKGKEKESDFKFTKHLIDQPNGKGWKIAHKVQIGLNSRTPLFEVRISDLQNHFINFMNPRNMFLFPKSLAGLAEIKAVIEAYK